MLLTSITAAAAAAAAVLVALCTRRSRVYSPLEYLCAGGRELFSEMTMSGARFFYLYLHSGIVLATISVW